MERGRLISRIANQIKGNTTRVDDAVNVLDYLIDIGVINDRKVLAEIAGSAADMFSDLEDRDDESRTVDAETFCSLIEVNLDNEKLDDKAFRDFIRNTLPIIKYSPVKKGDKDVGK